MPLSLQDSIRCDLFLSEDFTIPPSSPLIKSQEFAKVQPSRLILIIKLIDSHDAGLRFRAFVQSVICTMRRAGFIYHALRGFGSTMASESALRSAGTLQSRVRAHHRRPGLMEGLKA
ncbi:hypothetical protein PoB_004499100 [Plakobranchus ocellatus]|uniref:Uncharacterized protein n=1 Tax=Plakobranchus ocellatus TaxID=259542 RepID=A0AAV4BDJ2_9GAST|nr:hypothetical protein PoB_004499100 [Plakobranchus ocellatus]